MGDGAKFTGKSDLTEGAEWLCAGRAERSSARCAGDRQRDREIGAGLIDAHAADDVDENGRRYASRRYAMRLPGCSIAAI